MKFTVIQLLQLRNLLKKTRRSKAPAAPKKAAAEAETPATEAPAATDEATPAE